MVTVYTDGMVCTCTHTYTGVGLFMIRSETMNVFVKNHTLTRNLVLLSTI